MLREFHDDAVLRVRHRPAMSPGSELAWLNSHRWYAEGNGIHWKKYEKESDRLASMGITAVGFHVRPTISKF